MEWKLIQSQSDLDELIQSFMWHDSFIRESHVASPSYRVAGGTANAQLPACVRVLIASGYEDQPALELLFEKTSEFNLPLNSDLEPSGEYRDWKCYWSFDDGLSDTRCEQLRYRFIDNSAVEFGVFYALNEVFDQNCNPIL